MFQLRSTTELLTSFVRKDSNLRPQLKTLKGKEI